MNYKEIYNILYKEGYHINTLTNIGCKFVKDIIENYDFNSILDVGCSQGNAVKEYIQKGKKAFGIDISEIAIKEAHKLNNKTCQQASILNIPFSNNSFDLVVTSDVIEHLVEEDVEKAINELVRVSKKYIIAKIATKKEGNKTWITLLKNKYPSLVKNINNLHLTIHKHSKWKELFEKTNKVEFLEKKGKLLIFKKI